MELDEILARADVRRLAGAGIDTLAALRALNERELSGLRGIGPGTVRAIKDALTQHEVTLAKDPYEPYLCARETKRSRDAELRSYFLCDDCRCAYEADAFSGRAPEWTSTEPVTGFCSHCNGLKDLHLTQWLLCGNCDRVVRSLGRSKAAVSYVEAAWHQLFGSHPSLTLSEVDPPQLQPRGRRSDSARVARVDFVASRPQAPEHPVVALELKTGRRALPGGGVGSPMDTFQLDTTDCDDIRTSAETLGVPVLLLHAQVIGRAHAPTERFCGVGLWWARPWDLLDNSAGIRRRPRETRDAVYYRTSPFRPFAELPTYIAEQLPRDAVTMATSGFPQLYDRTKSAPTPQAS